VSSVNTCGEVLVGDEGIITFKFNHSQYTTEFLTCVWTIRSSPNTQMNFEIKENSLRPGTLLTLTPYKAEMEARGKGYALQDKTTVL